MKAIALAALPVIFALAAPVAVDARAPHAISAKSKKKVRGKPVAFATADAEPRTRLRDVQDPNGLTPLEFARWLRAHPRLASDTRDTVAFRSISAPTRLLNRSTEHFVEADRNGDGRVSADELADYIQPEVMTPLRLPTSAT